jgi:hypothetical protein
MVKWTDFASLFCLALTLLAVAALVTASQNFVIVRGKVVSTGSALVDSEAGKVPTRTVTIIIENDDRVFRIKSGTAVEYAVSDSDAALVRTGEQVELMLSSHQSKARVVNVEGRPEI